MDESILWTCLGTDCPNNCCGPFQGISYLENIIDTSNLGNIVGEDREFNIDIKNDISIFAQIALLPEDVSRLQNAGLESVIIRRVDDERRMRYFLKLEEDGGCSMLLQNGMCSIHEHRPTLCRAFPFYLDMFVVVIRQ
jgi:Fe-S-cluster containining protein